jgi:hypothetical protein
MIVRIEIGLRNHFEEGFWQDDVTIFIFVVGITIRIMDTGTDR